MKPFDEKEVIWATSGTGDDFQCVDESYARELYAEVERLRAALWPFAAQYQGKTTSVVDDYRRASEVYGDAPYPNQQIAEGK